MPARRRCASAENIRRDYSVLLQTARRSSNSAQTHRHPFQMMKSRHLPFLLLGASLQCVSGTTFIANWTFDAQTTAATPAGAGTSIVALPLTGGPSITYTNSATNAQSGYAYCIGGGGSTTGWPSTANATTGMTACASTVGFTSITLSSYAYSCVNMCRGSARCVTRVGCVVHNATSVPSPRCSSNGMSKYNELMYSISGSSGPFFWAATMTGCVFRVV